MRVEIDERGAIVGRTDGSRRDELTPRHGLAGRDEIAELRERSRVSPAATSSPRCARASTAPVRDARGLAGRDEVAALRERSSRPATRSPCARLDGLAGAEARDGLAGRDEVAALRARLDGLAGRDGLAELAGRDDVAALRERLDRLASRDELAGRDDLPRCASGSTASRRATSSPALAGRDEVAARDELDVSPRARGARGPRRARRAAWLALRERVEGLAGRDELALRDRLGALAGATSSTTWPAATSCPLRASTVSPPATSSRRCASSSTRSLDQRGVAERRSRRPDALDRITEVDRGAGTVLADVRALRGLVDEALAAAQQAVAPIHTSCAS